MSSKNSEYAKFMRVALEEAKSSLRKGNKGFGAVLVRRGKIIAKASDTATTESDPTAHAELNLVRKASKEPRNDLHGCTVISTHEPCPMCTGALIWAKVSEIAYGMPIAESKKQGRSMIDLSCKEIAKKSPWKVKVTGSILEQECSRLYDSKVRKLIEIFKYAEKSGWGQVQRELLKKRETWFKKNETKIRKKLKGTDVEKAYQLILLKLGITEREAPIIKKSSKQIVFHSMNPCPALEACKILGLDTRKVCKEYTEKATDELIKKINPRLKFSRNYKKLRPYVRYCEESVTLAK